MNSDRSLFDMRLGAASPAQFSGSLASFASSSDSLSETMSQWAGVSAATSETPTASLLDALLDPSCHACPSFMSPKSSLLGAAVLLVLSKGLCVLLVALLVALLDGAVKLNGCISVWPI